MTKRKKRILCAVLTVLLLAAGTGAAVERSRAVFDFHEYTVGYADCRAHYTLYRGGLLVRRWLVARPIAEHRIPTVEPEIDYDLITYHFTKEEKEALESLRADIAAFRTEPSWWQLGAFWRRKVLPVLLVVEICRLTEAEYDALYTLAKDTSSLPCSLESSERSKQYCWYWGWNETEASDAEKEHPVWLSLELLDLTNRKTGRNLSPRYGINWDPWGNIPVSGVLRGLLFCAAALLLLMIAAERIVRRIRRRKTIRRLNS